MPRLRWWRDDKVISKLEPVEDETRLSLLELRIPRLSREYFEAVYTCTADNTALVPPLRVNVQIQLYCKYLYLIISPSTTITICNPNTKILQLLIITI